MVSAVNAAVSGLDAATKRLQVSANNTANQSSTQSNVNGQVVDKPYTPQQVDQVTLSSGGVQAKVRDVNPPTTTEVNPSNPQGNTQQVPNVNPQQEVLNKQLASYDFKANLKTIKVANDTLNSLLNITA